MSGQVKFQNLSLQNPDSNIIYIGLDNKIKINGIKSFSNTKLVAIGMLISSSKNGNAILRATTVGISRLTLYDGHKLIATKQYHVKRIPEPLVGLASFRDTTLTISQIMENRKLISILPNCIAQLNFAVLGFSNTIVSKNETLYSNLKSKRDSLSEELIQIIMNLKSGDRIIFENIHVQGPDDTRIPPFYIIIK